MTSPRGVLRPIPLGTNLFHAVIMDICHDGSLRRVDKLNIEYAEELEAAE